METKTIEQAEKRMSQKQMSILLEGIRENACNFRLRDLLSTQHPKDAMKKGEELHYINNAFRKLMSFLETDKVHGVIDLMTINKELKKVQSDYYYKFINALQTADDELDMQMYFEDYSSFYSDCNTAKDYLFDLTEQLYKSGHFSENVKTA